MNRFKRRYVLLLVAGLAAAGCKKAAPPPDTSAAASDPEVVAMLAKADTVDGTEDKVVHRCASCRLGMDGSEKHALTVGEYEMYFCSAECKERFGKDVDKNILALVIEEGK